MATTDTTKQASLTAEEIDTITKEVNDFQQKSIQYAVSSPALSAHYWRLYTASKPSLKRFARMKIAADARQAAEQRKNARAGKNGTTPEATTTSGRQARSA